MDLDKLALAMQNSSPTERKAIELCMSNLNTILDLIIEKSEPRALKDNYSDQLISDKNSLGYDPAKEGQLFMDLNSAKDSNCEKLMMDNSVHSGYDKNVPVNDDNCPPYLTKNGCGEKLADNSPPDDNYGYCKNVLDNNSIYEAGDASPHGLHNYLYNIYDRWTDLFPTESHLNDRTKDSYCEKLMVDNYSVHSDYGKNVPVNNDLTDFTRYCENLLVDSSDVNNSLPHTNNIGYCEVTDNLSNNKGQLLDLNQTNDSNCEKLMVDNDTVHSGFGKNVPVNNDLTDFTGYCENPVVDSSVVDNSLPDADSSGYCEVVDNISINKDEEILSINGIANMDSTHINLTQIEDSINYFDQNGYVYSINNNKRELKSFYFRCKNSSGSHQCPARAIAPNKNLEQAKLTKKHCEHLPDKSTLAKTKFDKKLDKICAENEFMPRREIYFNAREQVHPDEVPFIPLRIEYGSFFSRRKSKVKPKNPTSIEEFEDLINDEKFKKRYCFDKRNLQFYRGVWTDSNGNKMIVFISETGLSELKKLKFIELLMDGTFKVLPKHIKFCQLYIMSFLYEQRCYPFAFFFMEKRDAEAYDLLFDRLISMMGPECAQSVRICMSDYEAAIRKILIKYFPNARISGCYFHYVKAIGKQAKRFGLSKHEKFEQPIRELKALALLPNDFVEEGFDVIDDKIEDSPQWSRFREYWERQWRPANISVYALKNRTDNLSEAFNRSFNLLNGKPHQNLWIVLKNLKQIEMDKSDELVKHVGGKMFMRPPNKIMAALNKKIMEATDRFDESEDVARFLQNVTYDANIQNACNQCHLLEDDENDEYGENDDIEEFLPNDFDQDSSFKRKPKLSRKRKFDSSGEKSTVEGLKKPRLGRKRQERANADKKKKVALFTRRSIEEGGMKPKTQNEEGIKGKK